MTTMEAAQPLARLSTATRMLAEARNLDEVRQIRDLAAAARTYAEAAGLGDEAIGYASAIKLDAERKGGEILAEMAAEGRRQTGGRPPKLSPSGTVIPALPELGVTRQQSARWQRLARMPEEEYKDLRAQVETRTRRASEKPLADQGAREWETTVQSMQSAESLRQAAVLHFASALMGASEALNHVDPPISVAEDEEYHLTVTATGLLRRLNRGKKLEVLK